MPKCIMLNAELRYAFGIIEIICEANSFILHYAFCILHFAAGV